MEEQEAREKEEKERKKKEEEEKKKKGEKETKKKKEEKEPEWVRNLRGRNLTDSELDNIARELIKG